MTEQAFGAMMSGKGACQGSQATSVDQRGRSQRSERRLMGQVFGGNAESSQVVYANIFESPDGSEVEWVISPDSSNGEPVELRVVMNASPEDQSNIFEAMPNDK